MDLFTIGFNLIMFNYIGLGQKNCLKCNQYSSIVFLAPIMGKLLTVLIQLTCLVFSFWEYLWFEEGLKIFLFP